MHTLKRIAARPVHTPYATSCVLSLSHSSSWYSVYVLLFFIRKWAACARDSWVPRWRFSASKKQKNRSKKWRKTSEINCIRSQFTSISIEYWMRAHGAVERKSDARQSIEQVMLVQRNPVPIICRTVAHIWCGYVHILYYIKYESLVTMTASNAVKHQFSVGRRATRSTIHNIKRRMPYMFHLRFTISQFSN